MLELISRALALWVFASSCGTTPRAPVTAAEHERKARSYDATADSIELECWKDRRNELTVDEPSWCWKAEDLRFLEANRNAATEHRAAASTVRTQSARR
jgi:hypothetical protein